MNVFQMRDTLKQRLEHLDVDFKFDREEETLRIYRRDNFKGVTIKLNAIVAKYEEQKEKSLMKLSIMLKRPLRKWMIMVYLK